MSRIDEWTESREYIRRDSTYGCDETQQMKQRRVRKIRRKDDDFSVKTINGFNFHSHSHSFRQHLSLVLWVLLLPLILWIFSRSVRSMFSVYEATISSTCLCYNVYRHFLLYKAKPMQSIDSDWCRFLSFVNITATVKPATHPIRIDDDFPLNCICFCGCVDPSVSLRGNCRRFYYYFWGFHSPLLRSFFSSILLVTTTATTTTATA